MAILQVDGIGRTSDDRTTEARAWLLDDEVEGSRDLSDRCGLRSRVDQGPAIGRTGVLAHESRP